ncbi:bifunctional alpha,alpha-trehalose-phosphate synthase (UDP-forming)/trehalose-phosphatase [Bombiscardovia apis]|uniref:Bifunctional alpha,alpha-trehalose-phosphate synthase (UDP-forming)/trehalose-phosphatase n=1 Tax=Bombiscardovia apis TaxID=2932182 RepID=A0ABM8BAN5_9BIFI|nr:trehalose-phosphatase [Bombiscardovia apis]BDR53982.1 bifunctional alpha,alpha-trehalose-phosphate synthase (UDP-forming)/trehalose-phosphatase [Bombiscardovia apis]
MSRLIIVSNRLPVSLDTAADGSYSLRQNVGGLATAIGPYHKSHRDCLWIGWSGIDPDQYSSEDLEGIKQAYQERRCVPIFLSQDELDGYYAGFSNDALWPLFHDFSHEASFNPSDWEMYRKVNKKFAQVIEPLLSKGDTIWIQDYHLMLLPKMLRERFPSASIGWFLHVPFPSVEIFRSLPWSHEVLEGVLGADLVGFHTTDFVTSFLACIRRLAPEFSVGDDSVVDLPDGHRAAVDAFPIGIDYNLYARTSRSSLAKAMRRGIETAAGKNRSHYRSSVTAEGNAAAEAASRDGSWWSHHNQEEVPELMLASSAASSVGQRDNKIIVSVDRLDYTKGLPERLEAFGRMLEKYPEWTGHVTYYLLATPSREDVESYRKLKSQVDELVGKINGRYSLLAWTPIHYITRSLSIKPVCGIYAAGDVALVTPLRDGMNLVAKEYLACHDGREGALVLSNMAGAAGELTDAFIVNPYDIDMVCEALHDALEISPSKTRAGNMRMQARLKVRTAQNWCLDFLDTLRQVTTAGMTSKRIRMETRNQMVSQWEQAKRRLILCDYDGTLTPLVRNPERAQPTKALRQMLRDIGSQPGVDLFLVSGRSHETMDEWFSDLPIGLIAEHGAWYKPLPTSPATSTSSAIAAEDERSWQRNDALPDPAVWQPQIRPIMDEAVKRVPQSFVEVKSDALAWHYRMSDPKLAACEDERLASHLHQVVSGKGLMVMRNSKVLEVCPVATSKGQAVQPLIESGKYDFTLAVGDDATDETMFSVIPQNSWSIKIGPGDTKARVRMTGPSAVQLLLRDLAAGTSTLPTEE